MYTCTCTSYVDLFQRFWTFVFKSLARLMLVWSESVCPHSLHTCRTCLLLFNYQKGFILIRLLAGILAVSSVVSLVMCLPTSINSDLGRHWIECRFLRLFSHDDKVRIFNRDSRCASRIMIRNTVFWTVCTPNHVEIRDLRCVTRKHLWTVIWDAHLISRISTWFGVHTVQNTVFWIVIQDAHLKSRFKIRTLPSCENSLSNAVVTSFMSSHPVRATSKKGKFRIPDGVGHRYIRWVHTVLLNLNIRLKT